MNTSDTYLYTAELFFERIKDSHAYEQYMWLALFLWAETS